LPDICPEKIVEAGSMPLLSSPNVANLKAIVWNVYNDENKTVENNPVILRLLACKTGTRQVDTTVCSYPDHVNKAAIKKACQDSKSDLAQIYFRHKIMDLKARSCIVVFIKGIYLHKEETLYKLYRDTIDWLEIADERPYFYIVFYGDPLFDLQLTKAYKNLKWKMKPISGKEDIFFMIYAKKGTEALDVTHTTTKFSVSVYPYKLDKVY